MDPAGASVVTLQHKIENELNLAFKESKIVSNLGPVLVKTLAGFKVKKS